ncbi:MAG: PTS sugar transporter subunit IIA [Deltaproteobacteria bacterium]|nr:PTS sugar transporter subunit IIA [Deltaproteobacteria bacterium]
MIGIVVITHGQLGQEFIKTAETIVGPLQGIVTLGTNRTQGVESLKQEVEKVIRASDQGEGVLVLTDMFGGTPSNLSLAFLEEEKVEVVTGVNLPMILKLSLEKRQGPLKEFAQYVRNYGQRNITLASEILKAEVGAVRRQTR